MKACIPCWLLAVLMGWPILAKAQTDSVPPTARTDRTGVQLTVAVYPLSALAAMYKAGVQYTVYRRNTVQVVIQGGFSDNPWIYDADAEQRSHTYLVSPDTSIRQYSSSHQMLGWGAECQFRHYISEQAQHGVYLGAWARVMQMNGKLSYRQEVLVYQSGISYRPISSTPNQPDGTYRLWGAGLGPLVGFQGIWGRLVLDAHLGFGANVGGLRLRGSRLSNHHSTAQNFMFGAENALVLKGGIGIGLVLGR